mgnify:CR=1 FL=1
MTDLKKLTFSECKAELQEIADFYGLKLNTQDFLVIVKVFKINRKLKEDISESRRIELMDTKRLIINKYKNGK